MEGFQSPLTKYASDPEQGAPLMTLVPSGKFGTAMGFSGSKGLMSEKAIPIIRLRDALNAVRGTKE